MKLPLILPEILRNSSELLRNGGSIDEHNSTEEDEEEIDDDEDGLEEVQNFQNKKHKYLQFVIRVHISFFQSRIKNWKKTIKNSEEEVQNYKT